VRRVRLDRNGVVGSRNFHWFVSHDLHPILNRAYPKTMPRLRRTA
jgi:hypothetical protein